ncbi:MAG: N-acetylmuramic acid 6-phosphate etherase, partial [Actinomycetota bacterium]|nr:N-acetylmuramic acid 6-phosphate etherase [Actinomycetota bacterium]
MKGGDVAAAATGDEDGSTLDALGTEGARPELADLDLWSTADALQLFVDDQQAVVEAVRAAARSIAAVVDAVAERMAAGGRLIYVGAGTGGRMAAVDAAEIGPSYGLSGRVVAVFAGGVDALLDGREYYEDQPEKSAAELTALNLTASDVVMGVSASGRTPYVLSGIAAARTVGARTIGFACVSGSPLAASCELAIEIPTGAEIIAGSTRLKAGSVQKVVLNAISTLVMVRLGRTYGNLMVDVVADNAKLRRRALRVVTQATGVD